MAGYNRWCVGDPAAAGCFDSVDAADAARNAWIGRQKQFITMTFDQ
jgi:hypothetical protein